MYDRLNEVKGMHEIGKKNDFNKINLHPRDVDWLIERAELLRKIDNAWEEIETNGTSEDADNFYTIVQDILSPPQDS